MENYGIFCHGQLILTKCRLTRGEFKKVMGLVIARKKTQEKVDSQEEWKEIKFMVFDVPNVDGIYESRVVISLR